MEEQRRTDRPLEPLVTAWKRRLERARTYKWEHFGKFAKEAVDFYVGPTDMAKFYKDHMRGPKNGVSYDEEDAGYMTVTNKASELVQLFGPSLYHRNPVRTVTVRERAQLPRELFVDPALERQVQQQTQALQQQMQQLQQQGQPPAMPGAPPPPPNPQVQMALQQMQMQLQQIQAPLQQAQQAYEQAVLSEQKATSLRNLKKDLLSSYLNYTPHELNLKLESRLAIDEALVKGAGCLWTETVERNGVTLVGSFFDSVDNLLVDPDVEKWADIRWVARRCVHTVAEVADAYGLDPERLRQYAKDHSHGAAAEDDVASFEGEPGVQGDLIVYWKIWSRMGFGDELPGLDDKYRELLQSLGDNVFLAYVPGMPAPLNVRRKHIDAVLDSADAEGEGEQTDGQQSPMQAAMDELRLKVSWPIPFWMDNGWPVEALSYHEMFGCVWPVSHLRPAMPELKALNHAQNHLLNRARETSRLIIGYDKGLEEDVSKILRSGKPICEIPVSMAGKEDISKMLMILQQPQGGATELMAVVASLEKRFADRTGLTELMYSQMGGMRSAAEAQIKQSSMNIRPDDMSNATEDWQSRIASKEALAALWLLDGQQVAPIIGQQQAQLWDKFLAGEDPRVVAMELDVRIEAGSTRKPNRETRVQQMNEAMRSLFAQLSQVAMTTGIVGPCNALVEEWGKSLDIQDIDRFMLPPPPPPQPPQPDPTAMAKIQADMQKTQMDGQIKSALAQQQMQHDERKAQLNEKQSQLEIMQKVMETQLKQKELEMKLQGQQMQMQMDVVKAAGEQQNAAQKHVQEMVQSANRADQEREIAERRAAAEEEQRRQQAKEPK